jgi:ferritin
MGGVLCGYANLGGCESLIKSTVLNALNDQMVKEFYSHYLYLSMAAYFESINLRGFAHWMRIQAKEEFEHAMKFFEHIIERQGKVVLETINAPGSGWSSAKNVFEDAYNHERKVTESIHKIVETARSEKEYPTEVFLQWFVKEQVEEEASASEILEKLKLVGSETSALFVLDAELGKRSSGS